MCYTPLLENDLNVVDFVIRGHILHLGLLHGPQEPSFLYKGRTLALTSRSFRLLALQKPIIGTSLKTLLCSWSGVSKI